MKRRNIILLIFSICFICQIEAQQKIKIDDREKSDDNVERVKKSQSTPSKKTAPKVKKTHKPKVGSPAPFKFAINRSDINCNARENNYTIMVTATNDWSINTYSVPSWLNVRKNYDSRELLIKVKANENTFSRSAKFDIISKDKTITISVTQSGAENKLEITPGNAYFDAKGGSQLFSINSTQSWTIKGYSQSWWRYSKDGNNLKLVVDKNTDINSRSDFFVIQSGTKEIRVNISQSGVNLYVNGDSSDNHLYFNSSFNKKRINVISSLDEYSIENIPWWCSISNKTNSGFDLKVFTNTKSFDRNNNIYIKSGTKRVRINIHQGADPKKFARRLNGGWVNMSLGFEGGYNVSGNNSWFANGLVGMRIGNYRDVVQFELGVNPGVVSIYNSDVNFHLPVYGSLKLSARSGKFYLKLGGAYNLIHDKKTEGDYSLRAGFGSAWKHFEWDWAYVQFNDPAKYLENSKSLFNTSNMFVGMRMAWYITQ